MGIRIIYQNVCQSIPIGSNGMGGIDYDWVCHLEPYPIIDWSLYLQYISYNYILGSATPIPITQEVTIAELDKIYPDIYSSFTIKVKFSKAYPLTDWVSASIGGVPLLLDGTENIITIPLGSTDNIEYTFNTAGLPEGSYSMNVELLAYGNSIGGVDFLDAEANLDITKGSVILLVSKTPQDPNDYGKLKYFFEYDNFVNDNFRCEIFERGFSGLPIEVSGSANLKYQDKKDIFEPIISCSLSIDFDSSVDLPFEDLYSEKENTFLIKYYRNGAVLFVGFLKPDGIWEDLVSDKWLMSIDGIDNLSILKSLSFVKPNGTFFIGKKSQIEVIFNLLLRTGLNLPINVSIDLSYLDIDTSTNSILEAVLINADRFYQDASKDKIMDCQEVLMSILQIYNATIFQQNGEWFIVRNIDLTDTITFKKYINGIYSSDNVIEIDILIGSDIEGTEIIHANANQKKSIMPSVQTFRVGYEYGVVKSIIENSDLTFGSGLYIEHWDLVNTSGTITKLNQGGFQFTGGANEIVLVSDQSILVYTIDAFKFYLKHSGSFGYVLKTDNYYLMDGVWTAGSVDYVNNVFVNGFYNQNKELEFTFDFTPPEDGELIIKIASNFTVQSVQLSVFDVEIRPNNTIYKGEFHVAQRNSRISSVTKDDITVKIGDSISDIYFGTLYKKNGFPTNNTWFRVGKNENRELLDIMAEDNLRVAPVPMKFIEGDIYGYIPYLSLIRYNIVSGKYIPLSYSYNPTQNMISLGCNEFRSDYITDFNIEKDFQYNNETKVTIK